MKRYPFALIFFAMVSYSLAGCAGDTKKANAAEARGAKIASSCVGCHGADGRHGKEGVPALGGRPYNELVQLLQDQRDSRLVQPLIVHVMSDEDIRDIATYYSNLK